MTLSSSDGSMLTVTLGGLRPAIGELLFPLDSSRPTPTTAITTVTSTSATPQRLRKSALRTRATIADTCHLASERTRGVAGS